MDRRRLRRMLPAAVALTGLAGLTVTAATSPAAAATGCDAPRSRVVVRFAAAADPAAVADRVAEAARACGGSVVAVQPAVGTAVLDAPAAAAAAVARVPGVAGVSPDAVARPAALTFDPATQKGALTNVARLTGATTMWQRGFTGAGVDVALIDTGVAPVPALADKAKVVVGPDLSFESQDTDLRYLDSNGHGTHMGTIIAGRETAKGTGATYAADRKNFLGMAPDARLVSVKVGSNDGAVDVSQLIAAIDWVVQNRNTNGLNIKVLNLSFGTDATQDWRLDPLSHAAEVAVRAGILVVASAGNDGATARGLADPAYNPHVLAVGAVDTMGTDRLDDDQVPAFSQHSDASLAVRPPDLVAPGVGIVAPAVPGSTLAAKYPAARIGGAFIRGNGTSQAAAVVSGAAALLWQKWPGATPIQIREMLASSAADLPSLSWAYKGAGELDLVAAAAAQPSAAASQADAVLATPEYTGSGAGTLQGARGSQSVTIDGVPLTGEKDIFGKPWSAATASQSAAALAAWALSTGTFNGSQWIGVGFGTDTATVAGRTWAGRTWAGRTWAGNAWSGRTWAGRTWSGRTWSGGTWAGGTWDDGVAPSDGAFNSRTWSSGGWQ